MTAQLLVAAVLGMTAAVMPGPFQVFLLGQSVRRGFRQSWPLTCIPLLSDGPIILLLSLAMSQIPTSLLRIIGLVGGAFLLYLAVQAWRASHQEIELQPEEGQRQFRSGVWMNLANPNPWIFWSLTGIPILLKCWAESPVLSLLFITLFYLAMIPCLLAQLWLFGTAAKFGARFNHSIQKLAALGLGVFGVLQIVGSLQ